MLDRDIEYYEKELSLESEGLIQDKRELEAAENENRRAQAILERKKTPRDALLAELEKKKALLVYDADDVKVQAEESARKLQDVDERLKKLQCTFVQTETSIMKLQAIKPKNDKANNLLSKLTTLKESIRELETGDPDSDSKDGEQKVLQTELSELKIKLKELRVTSYEELRKIRENISKRKRDEDILVRNLHEAEEKERQLSEQAIKASHRIEELKRAFKRYEQEKTECLAEINKIKEDYTNKLNAIEECLLNKIKETKDKLLDKLKKRST